MIRSILAVIAGFALWTALWLGGQFTLFAAPSRAVEAGRRFDDAMVLAQIIGYSILCSAAAGLCAALIARGSSRAPLILALILLAVGVAVEVSAWTLTPVWYHIVFLALLIPATLIGARLARVVRHTRVAA